MALIKFNKQSFIECLEPGITVLIVDAFKDRLEEKLNNIVEEVYAELKKELPDKIALKLYEVLDPGIPRANANIQVVVNFESDK
jgi:hypothetical protein